MDVNDAKHPSKKQTWDQFSLVSHLTCDIGDCSRQSEEHQSHIELVRLKDRGDETERSRNLTLVTFINPLTVAEPKIPLMALKTT